MADEISTPIVILRKEARAKGLLRYFTGKECHQGHVDERFTETGRCVICNKIVCGNFARANRKKCTASQREWRNLNIVRARQTLKERRKRPEVLAKHNAYNAEWRKKNKGWVAKWVKENPDQAKVLRKRTKFRRRLRESSSAKEFNSDDIKRIYKLQKGKCAYCKINLNGKYQIDHIMPLAKGGSNTARNLQLLCPKIGRCNQQKSDKDPMAFARELGFLL